MSELSFAILSAGFCCLTVSRIKVPSQLIALVTQCIALVTNAIALVPHAITLSIYRRESRSARMRSDAYRARDADWP